MWWVNSGYVRCRGLSRELTGGVRPADCAKLGGGLYCTPAPLVGARKLKLYVDEDVVI